ncbi:MAG: aldo/keto reductase, partial [Oscillospiraceae bacterium]
MKYRKDAKSGKDLSVLGFGCMRFTKKGNKIDQEKAEAEMLCAIKRGVNYFDTAYIYPGSEAALGEFLAKGYRDSVYIATKLPHYIIKSLKDADRIFEEELKRLKTDHVDYYLMHMLTDLGSWERLCNIGIKDWIEKRKKNGQIRHIGFSFHGGTHSFKKIVDAYDWEFCQIQFNYMDEYSQAGTEGLKYAAHKGLPVVVMEPLRGGRLVNGLSHEVKQMFATEKPLRSPAEWAFRWIWNFPEVTTILSGMNSTDQVLENTRIASEVEPGELSESELNLLTKVKVEINKTVKVSCSGCGYCMPCPMGVDIPTCFRTYNVKYTDGWRNALREYLMCTTFKATHTNASKCVACGKCEQHCPQAIEIRKELKNVKNELEG